MTLPAAFDERIKKQLNEEYKDYRKCLEEDMNHGIRINTLKISVEDFLKISPFDLKPVPWTANGFYYDEKKDTPSRHPYYYAGLYYIQEPSAMLPAEALRIDDNDMVLDICAAPGGKSTELAAKLHGSGMIISNDISHSRAKALLKNMEISGVGNLCVVSEAPNRLSEVFGPCFDKILVDAPCSGEGMFRKSSSMMTAWERNGVDFFAGLQKGILKEIVKLLKPGGMLLYSTCTFSPEENEQSVEYLLSLDDSLELVDMKQYPGFDHGHPEWGLTGSQSLLRCTRIWPHRVKGEGHFAALLQKRKTGLPDTYAEYRLHPYRPEPVVCEFLDDIEPSAGIHKNRLEETNGRIYHIPEHMPDVRGLRLLRNGLFLGEVKKNRFEPSQALAMYLKEGDYRYTVSFTAGDDRVTRYLKGETVMLTDEEAVRSSDGYILVCVDGYPLGWAKNQKGMLKNKYLSGWRMLS